MTTPGGLKNATILHIALGLFQGDNLKERLASTPPLSQ